MKPTQILLLLLAVVALIFGVTFASMYVSQSPRRTKKGGPREEDSANDQLALVFLRKEYPDATDLNKPQPRLITEYGARGHFDFWFHNPNAEVVTLGVSRKSCTCSDLRLFTAPNDWASLAGKDRAALEKAAAGAEARGELFEGKDGVSIAAGTVGFVRLSWEAKRATGAPVKPERLGVDLWMQNPRKGGNVRLMTVAHFVEPINLDTPEIKAGILGSGDTVTQVVRLWSWTRDAFELEARSTGAPFVVIGPRQPLTEEDRNELTRRTEEFGGLPPRSGYRYPVTVRERVPEGPVADEGPFQHALAFRPTEKISVGTSLDLPVRGTVRGDVTVLGHEQGITLPPFRVKDGVATQVTVQTARRELGLKLERVPDFMHVKLSEPKEEGGRKTWVMNLQIEPNRISGAFPRNESEALRDTAIYLKVEGADRRLRIPVAGKAQQ